MCPCRTPWWFPLGKLPVLNDPRLETKSAAAGLVTLSQPWLPSLLTSSSQDEAVCSCGFKGLICASTCLGKLTQQCGPTLPTVIGKGRARARPEDFREPVSPGIS